MDQVECTFCTSSSPSVDFSLDLAASLAGGFNLLAHSPWLGLVSQAGGQCLQHVVFMPSVQGSRESRSRSTELNNYINACMPLPGKQPNTNTQEEVYLS